MTTLKCRKCRHNLGLDNYKKSQGCLHENISQSFVIYLEIEDCPIWITEAVNQAGWTKGKLYCGKCKGRLGSFDFLNQVLCSCQQHYVPPVHLLKDRIDEMLKSIVTNSSSRQLISPASYNTNRTICSGHTPAEVLDNLSASASSLVVETREDICLTPNTSAECLLVDSGNLNELIHMDTDVSTISTNSLSESVQLDTWQTQDMSVVMSDCSRQAATDSCPIPVSSTDSLEEGTEWAISSSSRHSFGALTRSNYRRSIKKRFHNDLNDSSTSTTDYSHTDRHYNRYRSLQVEEANLESNKDTAQHDTDNIETEVEIPSELTCAVCLELFYRPHRCQPCRHIFCEHCLKQIRREKPVKTQCPLCREVIWKCFLQTDLFDQIKTEYSSNMKKRSHEIRKMIKEQYPLPSYTPGTKFEDKRLYVDEMGKSTEWAALKSKMPQQVLPVLEVDGKQLSQSLTICRYLAREFGLIGKTNWEQAQVEQIVDTMDDLRAEVAKWIYEKDSTEKNKIASKLRSDIYPKFTGILESILRENQENNNSSGYFVGNDLTLADLSVFETFTFPLSIHPDILDDHLELQEHRQRIETHTHLADYIKNRPVRPV